MSEHIHDPAHDAIAEIEKLEAKVERLREALYCISNTPPNLRPPESSAEQWYRRLVLEMKNQADQALAATEGSGTPTTDAEGE